MRCVLLAVFPGSETEAEWYFENSTYYNSISDSNDKDLSLLQICTLKSVGAVYWN